MSDGPRNFNHTKVSRPLRTIPSSISWRNIAKTEIPDGKWQKTMRASCTRRCKVIAATQTTVCEFFALIPPRSASSKATTEWCVANGWHGAPKFELMADPSFDPDNPQGLYIPGQGGRASIVCLDDEWWIVFGYKQRKNIKHLVLHNILCDDFDPGVFDVVISQLGDAVGTWLASAQDKK